MRATAASTIFYLEAGQRGARWLLRRKSPYRLDLPLSAAALPLFRAGVKYASSPLQIEPEIQKENAKQC